jgi:2-polyprenyl-6-methoxyphenol hydroxylase-like FAD-dependent oxidoreductase
MTTSNAALDAGQVPVLICGAGPVGLIMSMFLSRQGIDNVVVEKRSSVSQLPRARGITARSVEILSQLGLREKLDAISLGPDWTKYFVYTETIAGQLIGKMQTEIVPTEATARFSPSVYRVAAQDRIDPMLFEAAVSYPEARIVFDTEVVRYRETPDGVETTLRKKDGSVTTIRSRYLVAADGARSPLRQMAGIAEQGRARLRSFINNHIRADFSRYTQGKEGALIWTLAPGREGVFQILDGRTHWAVQIQFDPDNFEPASWTDEKAADTIRAMIGVPEGERVDIEVLRSYTYTLSFMVSETLRKGRLILTGDAAHQVPPYGGFGLNTGLQSAHNLAWKLGAVLRGEAPDALLDTYDVERREVAMRVTEFGRTNAGYIEKMMNAVHAAATLEEKTAVLAASKQYGNWLGLDLGVHYEGAGAFVPDDAPPPTVTDPVVDFIPHAKPGYRAPHFWYKETGDMERRSSIMLFDNVFVLLAGDKGQAWVDAARSLGDAPRIKSYVVGGSGELAPEVSFTDLYGVSNEGAVLVRPDGHVAFRSKVGVQDARQTLREVLDKVLCRAPES